MFVYIRGVYFNNYNGSICQTYNYKSYIVVEKGKQCMTYNKQIMTVCDMRRLFETSCLKVGFINGGRSPRYPCTMETTFVFSRFADYICHVHKQCC